MDELKACPGCGKAGMETYQRLESFLKCHSLGLFGCVHCGIYTITAAAWNALPRQPEPPTLVWSSERPKAVGWYFVRHESDHALLAVWKTDEADLGTTLRFPGNVEFAGPIPEPKEAPK